MPIAYRDKATSILDTAAATFDFTLPAGKQVGDVMILWLYATGNPTITKPAGWTDGRFSRDFPAFENVSTQGVSAMYWRVVDGTEPANYTFAFSVAARAIATVAAYSGVNRHVPVGRVRLFEPGGTSTAIALGSTATVENAWRTSMAGARKTADPGLTFSIDAPEWAERSDVTTTGGTSGTRPSLAVFDSNGVVAQGPSDRVVTMDSAPTSASQIQWTTDLISDMQTGTGPIAFRGSSFISNNVNSPNSITVDSSFVEDGDLILAFVNRVQTGGSTTAIPAGFAILQGSYQTPTTAHTEVYWKIATNEPDTLTWTLSGSGSVVATVALVAYSGVNTSSPIGAWAAFDETTDRTDHPTPTITTRREGSWVVTAAAYGGSRTTTTSDASDVERQETGGNVSASIYDSNRTYPAGSAIPSRTLTSNTTTNSVILYSFEIQPGAAAEPPPEEQEYDEPVVKGVYTGPGVASLPNPSVLVTEVPEPGDVFIVACATVASDAAPTSISGLGATWTRLPGGSTYQNGFWMGTGATKAGTITVNAAAATTGGRVVRAYHLAGVTADAMVMRRTTSDSAIRTTSNQIAIGFGACLSSTVGCSIADLLPLPGAWTKQAEVLSNPALTNRRFNSAHLIPKWTADAYIEGGSSGVLIVVGTPVKGETITKRRLMTNTSFQNNVSQGWTTTGGSSGVETTLGYIGDACYRLTANAAAPKFIRSTTSGGYPPVLAGNTYTFSCYVRRPTSDRNGRAFIIFRDDGGSTTVSTVNGTTTLLPFDNWVRLTVTATAPAGSYWASPGAEFTDGVSGDIFYFDAAQFEDGAVATDYWDATIAEADRFAMFTADQSYLGYSIQITEPPTPTPQVIGVHNGSPTASGAPTVNLPVTPQSDDVLIVGTIVNSSTGPHITALSGCGATWEPIPGAAEYMKFWIGTGATGSGAITATGTAISRALRLFHLRGVTPDVFFQRRENDPYPLQATPNQIVIGGAFTQSSTAAAIALTYPDGVVWTEGTEQVLVADRRFNAAYLIPKASNEFDLAPDAYGCLLVVGVPVAGMEVVRRNLVGNSGIETSDLFWLGGTGLTLTFRMTTQQHSGLASVEAEWNDGTQQILTKGYGSNGPSGEVEPGRTYTVSGWVRSDFARTGGIYPQWLSYNNGLLSNGAYTAGAFPANTWTRFSWTGVAPAGAYFASPAFRVDGQEGDTYWWDDFLIEEGEVLGDYFDAYTTPPADHLNYFVGSTDTFQSVQLAPIPEGPEIPAPDPITLRRRESGVWVVHTGVAKARIGGEWVPVQGKSWNGTAWVDLS
jgi:hypothetical protein